MASIRIEQFAGILPELNSRLKPKANAQIAHNCILADGSLRPQAKWVQQQQYYSAFSPSVRGIAYDKFSDTAVMYLSFDPVTLPGSPFGADTTVGASPASLVQKYKTGVGFSPSTVAVYSDGVAGSVTYERSFDSIKPVNRMYATSRVRKTVERVEEGGLIPVNNQDPSAVLYEGDLVTVTLNAAALDDGATHIRLYRTISGLDTGQTVGNDFDTEWYLVDELPLIPGNVVTYVDGNSATALPLDWNFSQRFHPPQLVARYFGLSESGWFVAGSLGGDIQISERYMHHAWPTENAMLIPEEISDMAVHLDNVYVGTTARPYIVSLSAGEKALQNAATPYGEHMPCLPNSMAASASGAVYASGAGLVALGREGMEMLSQDVVNAGDVLYSKNVTNGVAIAKIANTSSGTYFQGKYYGFCEGPPIDDGVYYTTTLYPLEFKDNLGSAAGPRIGKVTTNTDMLVSEAEFAGGTLRSPLISYTMDPNADGQPIPNGLHIISEADFVGGALNTILITTTVPQEGIDSTGALLGGDLNTILITTDMAPEGINSTGALLSGTLI
jgi:hypothetical protein